MMRRGALRALAGAVILLGACARQEGPGEPAWGKQTCAYCSMVMSDRRFGAQLAHSGEQLYFDDIGCLVLFVEERKIRAPRAWVHDAQTGLWLEAQAAHYVSGSKSPMDFGFEGHHDEGATWDDMRASVLSKRKDVQ